MTLLASCGAPPVQAGPRSMGAGLQGPAGLAASVYARGLPHVAALVVDAAGRLWAATAAYSDAQAGNDGVYVVSTAAAAPRKVIGGLRTPLGLLWYGAALYVASKERVEAYSGFDGAHFTHVRTVLSLPAGVGELNTMVLAPDGMILMGVSASCDHCTPASPYSAAVLAFRPDGGGLHVFASHIRAPVGLALFPGTDDLFVTMNQRDDLGGATPGDWLALVRQGQSWGSPACYGQGGIACRGVPAPLAVLARHAAVSDVVIVTGQLGAGVGTAALAAEWATGAIADVTLHRAGGAYQAAVSTPITGMRMPVALVLGPDGALYAGDWDSGTVFRIAAAS